MLFFYCMYMYPEYEKKYIYIININQTFGHPHCDNNYATLFVEGRVCNYVRPNYARIIY